MSLRAEYGSSQPLKGARIAGLSSHDYPDCRFDRDVDCAWRGSKNGAHAISSPRRDQAAAAIAEAGIGVYAWKGPNTGGS